MPPNRSGGAYEVDGGFLFAFRVQATTTAPSTRSLLVWGGSYTLADGAIWTPDP